MNSEKMTEQIDQDRRRFCGAAAMTVAAAQFGAFKLAWTHGQPR